MFATLRHHEPDRVPWGEHWIDYNVYEAVLGREREIIDSANRDVIDLAEAGDLDVVELEVTRVRDPVLVEMFVLHNDGAADTARVQERQNAPPVNVQGFRVSSKEIHKSRQEVHLLAESRGASAFRDEPR